MISLRSAVRRFRCSPTFFKDLHIAGFFCPLKKLVRIDLSSNAITDLNNLGLNPLSKDTNQEFRCNLTAKSLHLRHNGLVAVTPNSLSALGSLQHLDLSHNHIGVLVEAAFEGLATLQTIDLSFNRLAAIPPKIFRTTVPNLRTLILANNTLGTIDLEVFSHLTQLQTLNMSGNNLDENWIRPGIFAGLHHLIGQLVRHQRFECTIVATRGAKFQKSAPTPIDTPIRVGPNL